MTYCVGMLVDEGLAMIADTRTNAGVDNISSYRKLHIVKRTGERVLAVATAGNLSVTQTALATVAAGVRLPDSETPETLERAPTLFRAAQILGHAMAMVRAAKVWAASQGRNYVLPDDVKDLVPHVWTHRLVLDPEAVVAARLLGPADLPGQDPADARARRVSLTADGRRRVDAVVAAAVADWRVDTIAGGKIKKGPGGPPTLALIENPDILAGVAAPGPNRPALVIGFAAETTDLEANARAKLSRKGCDWILGNDVSDDVFGSDGNAVLLVTADKTETWPRQSKTAIARAVAAGARHPPGTRGAHRLCRARSWHQQLPPSGCRADQALVVPRGRCVLAHRASGRGAGRVGPPLGRGDGPRGRRARRLPRQADRPADRPHPPDRHRGLPLGRKRRRIS